MSRPVKLSAALVLDARLTGEIMERSIAGQVEFWARPGRSVGTLLAGWQVLNLRRKGRFRPISACKTGPERIGQTLISLRLRSKSNKINHLEEHSTPSGFVR